MFQPPPQLGHEAQEPLSPGQTTPERKITTEESEEVEAITESSESAVSLSSQAALDLPQFYIVKTKNRLLDSSREESYQKHRLHAGDAHKNTLFCNQRQPLDDNVIRVSVPGEATEDIDRICKICIRKFPALRKWCDRILGLSSDSEQIP